MSEAEALHTHTDCQMFLCAIVTECCLRASKKNDLCWEFVKSHFNRQCIMDLAVNLSCFWLVGFALTKSVKSYASMCLATQETALSWGLELHCQFCTSQAPAPSGGANRFSPLWLPQSGRVVTCSAVQRWMLWSCLQALEGRSWRLILLFFYF